jgi:hypothetical protein
MTVVMPWGVDSAPEASPRFPPRSTTALYLAVPWLKIHIMESILSARTYFEAARCAVYLPDAGSEEGATVSVV